MMTPPSRAIKLLVGLVFILIVAHTLLKPNLPRWATIDSLDLKLGTLYRTSESSYRYPPRLEESLPVAYHEGPTVTKWEPEPQPIIVLQHWADDGVNVDKHQDLSELSIRQHRRYTAAHGYKYKLDRTAYLDAEWGWASRFHNKLFAILATALEEMALGDEGAKWIA